MSWAIAERRKVKGSGGVGGVGMGVLGGMGGIVAVGWGFLSLLGPWSGCVTGVMSGISPVPTHAPTPDQHWSTNSTRATCVGYFSSPLKTGFLNGYLAPNTRLRESARGLAGVSGPAGRCCHYGYWRIAGRREGRCDVCAQDSKVLFLVFFGLAARGFLFFESFC